MHGSDLIAVLCLLLKLGCGMRRALRKHIILVPWLDNILVHASCRGWHF